MLQWEHIKVTCEHKPYRRVVMHDFVQFRCRCGRIVSGNEKTVCKNSAPLLINLSNGKSTAKPTEN